MEWGYLFVPIQAGFLPEPVIEGLLLLQLAMKPISFALLFQFGVELVTRRGPGRTCRAWRASLGAVSCRWPRSACGRSSRSPSPRLPRAGFVPDPGAVAAIGARSAPALAGVGAPLAVGDVLARVLLALPASLLVAVGLRRTARVLGPVAGPA